MSDSTLTAFSAGSFARNAVPADYFALLKPRVMSLVVFTGAVGMLLAPGELHPVLAFAALLCIAIGAGASGAINMWFDRDIDARMARTRERPIPAGRVMPGTALAFGIWLSIGSVALMALAVNWLAAILLAFTICFYVFVYTMWLKRKTPQNIVIGGAAGALPPVIGWAAVSGEVGLASLVLFIIIFMWTPPHFWALALVRADEYKQVGVPMLPVIAGAEATRLHIFWYSIALVLLTFAPVVIGLSGVIYGIGAALLGAVFVTMAMLIRRRKNNDDARRLFSFSILYLFLIFVLLAVDHMSRSSTFVGL